MTNFKKLFLTTIVGVGLISLNASASSKKHNDQRIFDFAIVLSQLKNNPEAQEIAQWLQKEAHNDNDKKAISLIINCDQLTLAQKIADLQNIKPGFVKKYASSLYKATKNGVKVAAFVIAPAIIVFSATVGLDLHSMLLR